MAAVPAAPAFQHVRIGNVEWAAFPNPSLKNKDGSDKTSFDFLVQFCKEIPFRVLQSVDRIVRVASYIFKEMSSFELASFCDAMSSKLGIAWGMLALPRLPEVTRNAWKTITNWSAPEQPGPATSEMRPLLTKINSLTDAGATWLYGMSLLLGNLAMKNIADWFDLAANFTDLANASEDYNLATQNLDYMKVNNLQVTHSLVNQRFEDTKSEAFMRIVKATASIASAILGLAVAGFVAPSYVLLGLGCASTAAAIMSWIFKETSVNEKVDFFKYHAPLLVIDGAPAA
jgi:hypothetical protein